MPAGANTYNITVEAFDGREHAGEYCRHCRPCHRRQRDAGADGNPRDIHQSRYEYDENDEYAVMDVAAYTARDEEGAVTWSLTGTDGGDFAVDSGGVVTFVKHVPNWEDAGRLRRQQRLVRIHGRRYRRRERHEPSH